MFQSLFFLFILQFFCSLELLSESKTKLSSQHWIRLKNQMSHLRVSPNQRYLAFFEKKTKKLNIIDLVRRGSQAIATLDNVEKNFLWSPFSQRVFFASQKMNGKKLKIAVTVYNLQTKDSTDIYHLDSNISQLSYDRNNFRLLFMEGGKLHSSLLRFVTKKGSSWEKPKGFTFGNWIIKRRKIYWLNYKKLHLVQDLSSDIQSFDVSQDGKNLVWSTSKNEIMKSYLGQRAEFVDEGKSASWHPYEKIICYASMRKFSNKVINWDLKVVDAQGRKKWLTSSPYRNENWPQWFVGSEHNILYTSERTSDLFKLKFYEENL